MTYLGPHNTSSYRTTNDTCSRHQLSAKMSSKYRI